MITLTKEIILSCRTDKGGFTHETMRHLTGNTDYKKGWLRRLIGTEITEESLQKAKEGNVVYKESSDKRNEKPSKQFRIVMDKLNALEAKVRLLQETVDILSSEIYDN